MRIYLLHRRTLVGAVKPIEKVVTCGIVIGSSLIVGEVVPKRRTRKLSGEEIDLVQEQNLGDGFWYAKGRKERDEPTIDVLMNHHALQGKRLLHMVLIKQTGHYERKEIIIKIKHTMLSSSYNT